MKSIFSLNFWIKKDMIVDRARTRCKFIEKACQIDRVVIDKGKRNCERNFGGSFLIRSVGNAWH